MGKDSVVAESNQIGAYHGAKRHHPVSGIVRVKKREAENY